MAKGTLTLNDLRGMTVKVYTLTEMEWQLKAKKNIANWQRERDKDELNTTFISYNFLQYLIKNKFVKLEP
jgi:hypothetical protein